MSSEKPVVVVKYGSSSVANHEGMDKLRLHKYVRQLAEMRHDYGLVVVTSGAVATGRALLGEKAHDVSDQTQAGVGHAKAFTAWQLVMLQHDVHSAYIPVTHHEISDRDEGSMLSRAIRDHSAADIISVINENDALSDTELIALQTGGDNDGLAGHIAERIGASQLCLMTDVEGLLDEQKQVVELVTPANIEWALSLADEIPGPLGTGGMRRKLNIGLKMALLGIDAHIGKAETGPMALIQRHAGTHFQA